MFLSHILIRNIMFLEAHLSLLLYTRRFFVPDMKQILPWLYFLFSLIYAICLYIWHFNIQLIKDGKPGYFDSGDAPAPPAIPGAAATPTTATIYPIHYLMGFLLALKFCTLIFESIRYHYLRVSGHAVFSSAVYYTFSFLKGMTLFTGKSIRNRKTLVFHSEDSNPFDFFIAIANHALMYPAFL